MEQAAFLFLLVGFWGTLVLNRWLVDALAEAIANLRGGPPGPVHPLPADDKVRLRQRLRRFSWLVLRSDSAASAR